MIPTGIGRQHVLKALRVIDREGVPAGRESRGVTIDHENNSYPVKLAVSLAAKAKTGRELPSSAFITTEAVSLLSRLGFSMNRTGSPKEPAHITSQTNSTARPDRVRQRMEQRVRDLISSPAVYLDAFDRSSLFTGPSLYFHFRTLERLHGHRTPSDAVVDESFLESLYATLTAWGMHRMGPGGAKLVEFERFVQGFASQRAQIREIEHLKLEAVSTADLRHVCQEVWRIISTLAVSASETKIVAGSKALHHVLPELVPPIDREYTLSFFYGHKTLNRGDQRTFAEIFPQFHRILLSCQEEVKARIGSGMNTSSTKVIDNSLVGYVRLKLKKTISTQESQ